MRPLALLIVTFFLSSTTAVAGLKEGYAALIKKDYVTAAKEYRPLAERGDAEAQYRIGRMYEFGNGYRQDKAQGIAWIRRAAAQGHADAEQELGVVYATGDGVMQDDVQAVAWFRKAAEHGDATAQYNLGLLYAKGQGVAQDYAQSVDWWRKAAAEGNGDAQFKLAVVYHNGEGAPRDEIAALANAMLAARNGDKENIAYRDEIAKSLTPRADTQGFLDGRCLEDRTAASRDYCRVRFGVGCRGGGSRGTDQDSLFRERNDGWREVQRKPLRGIAV